jgi:hypothetical protein
VGAETQRELAPERDRIDGDDERRAGAAQQLRDEKADDARAEDDDAIAETRMRVEHDIRRGLDVREERRALCVDAVREPDREALVDDVLGLMRMMREDERAGRRRHLSACVHDAAHARVPVLDREVERAAQGRQVERQFRRHFAAIDEHLRAVADRARDRAHADLSWPERRERLVA